MTGSGTIIGVDTNDVIVGSDGADTINGRGGDNLISALGGDDTIAGGRGDNRIDAGDGIPMLPLSIPQVGTRVPRESAWPRACGVSRPAKISEPDSGRARSGNPSRYSRSRQR